MNDFVLVRQGSEWENDPACQCEEASEDNGTAALSEISTDDNGQNYSNKRSGNLVELCWMDSWGGCMDQRKAVYKFITYFIGRKYHAEDTVCWLAKTAAIPPGALFLKYSPIIKTLREISLFIILLIFNYLITLKI